MAHHKRRRPKHQRAGCLLCKPHKDERGSNGRDERGFGGNQRRLRAAEEEVRDWERQARKEASGRAREG